MRDAYQIHGEKIFFRDKEWEIGVVYFLPGNNELYVQLKDGITSMNVRLSDIISLITSIAKSF